MALKVNQTKIIRNKQAISFISQYCRKIQNVAISALFKAKLRGRNPALRQFWTLCNSAVLQSYFFLHHKLISKKKSSHKKSVTIFFITKLLCHSVLLLDNLLHLLQGNFPLQFSPSAVHDWLCSLNYQLFAQPLLALANVMICGSIFSCVRILLMLCNTDRWLN